MLQMSDRRNRVREAVVFILIVFLARESASAQTAQIVTGSVLDSTEASCRRLRSS
jgi:hypothetical protein